MKKVYYCLLVEKKVNLVMVIELAVRVNLAVAILSEMTEAYVQNVILMANLIGMMKNKIAIAVYVKNVLHYLSALTKLRVLI